LDLLGFVPTRTTAKSFGNSEMAYLYCLLKTKDALEIDRRISGRM